MTDVHAATTPSPAPLPLTTRRAPVQRNGRPPAPRSASSGLTPRVRRAINLMIWGGDDGIPMGRPQAAIAAGMADVSLRQALAKPMVIKHYNEQLEVLRTGARPRAIHEIAELSKSAKSEAVKLKAAIHIDGGDKGSGVTVNVGINANIAPGYQVVIPQQYADAAPQILHLARSTRNVLESQADVPTDDGGTP